MKLLWNTVAPPAKCLLPSSLRDYSPWTWKWTQSLIKLTDIFERSNVNHEPISHYTLLYVIIFSKSLVACIWIQSYHDYYWLMMYWMTIGQWWTVKQSWGTVTTSWPPASPSWLRGRRGGWWSSPSCLDPPTAPRYSSSPGRFFLTQSGTRLDISH